VGSREGVGATVRTGVGDWVGDKVGCTMAVGVAVGVGAGGLTHPRKNNEMITMKTGINLLIFIATPILILTLFINNLIDTGQEMCGGKSFRYLYSYPLRIKPHLYDA
jgi:hypothetical protein